MPIRMRITRGKHSHPFPKGMGEEVAAVLKEAGLTEGEFHLKMFKAIKHSERKGVVVTKFLRDGIALRVQPERGSTGDRRECVLHYPPGSDVSSCNERFVTAVKTYRSNGKKEEVDMAQVIVHEASSPVADSEPVADKANVVRRRESANPDWHRDEEFMYCLLSEIKTAFVSGSVHYRVLARIVRCYVFSGNAAGADPRRRVHTLVSAGWLVGYKTHGAKRVTNYEFSEKSMELLLKYEGTPRSACVQREEQVADNGQSETPKVVQEILAQFARLPELRKRRDEVQKNIAALREELTRMESVWGQINKEVGEIQLLEGRLRAVMSAEKPQTE